ncbi:MAG: glyoxalase [Ruminococcus sp.]|nr:glyoxalase [Ruminococcus sp.]
MKISHIGMYVRDLERSRKFYETYFDGKSNCQYHNPKTNLKTYFLTFESGARLELMHRPEYTDSINEACASGLTHLAFSTGSRGGVDALTAKLAADGYIVAGQPRTTGDGYYESVVLDPDGYRIEITE